MKETIETKQIEKIMNNVYVLEYFHKKNLSKYRLFMGSNKKRNAKEKTRMKMTMRNDGWLRWVLYYYFFYQFIKNTKHLSIVCVITVVLLTWRLFLILIQLVYHQSTIVFVRDIVLFPVIAILKISIQVHDFIKS